MFFGYQVAMIGQGGVREMGIGSLNVYTHAHTHTHITYITVYTCSELMDSFGNGHIWYWETLRL